MILLITQLKHFPKEVLQDPYLNLKNQQLRHRFKTRDVIFSHNINKFSFISGFFSEIRCLHNN